MPTYRFDIRDGRTIHDPHGNDLPDDEAAFITASSLLKGSAFPSNTTDVSWLM
jgi:hypothetical protein